MELSREHFDSVGTLDAMDEVAMLVFVSQELRKMAATFAKSAEIDKKHADAPATAVLKAVKEVSETLMEPLFGKNGKREDALHKARKRGAKKLEVAIARAQELEKMEREAFAGSGVRGDSIQIQVVDRLTKLVANWRSLPDL